MSKQAEQIQIDARRVIAAVAGTLKSEDLLKLARVIGDMEEANAFYGLNSQSKAANKYAVLLDEIVDSLGEYYCNEIVSKATS